nr:retrovirus-related Pol polyprotein from transposon TNT 1-94 [Tanacetum cinerariifolium]
MSYVRTPQQNGVVERRNRTLVEAARTMLIFSRAPLFLWAEAIATACFTQKRSIIHRRFNKTPYELINDRKPDISFFHVFSAPCFPKNDREDIGKLGAKGDIEFFIGYSADSCAYRVYNRSLKPGLQNMTSGHISSGLDLTYAPSTITTQQPSKDTAPIPTNSSSLATNIPITSQDVDELNLNAMIDGNMFVSPFANSSTSAAASSSQQNALTYPAWIDSMQEELLQFKRLDVWVLVPAPDNISPLTLKLLFKNKHDEEQTVIRNKSRFIDADHPSHVYKLKKALYGLKQAPRAWYDELSKFLLQNHFFKGTIDPALFIRRFYDDILVDSGFELTGFSDADYAGCKNTFKSTSGGAQFLGEKP